MVILVAEIRLVAMMNAPSKKLDWIVTDSRSIKIVELLETEIKEDALRKFKFWKQELVIFTEIGGSVDALFTSWNKGEPLSVA